MRILFADPARELIEIYEKLLGRSGHEVVPAYDGVQAMEAIRKEVPDLLILRETLPRYDANHVLETAKACRIPVIRLQDAEREETDGVCSLVFPFLPEELEARIHEVTNHE